MLNENTRKVQLCVALEAESGFWLGGLWKNQGPMHAAEESKHKNYICSCTQGALTLGEVEVLDSRLRWEGDMKSGLESPQRG